MILCVTGPMAAGKNFVSAILEEKGFISVDADQTVHQVLKDPQVVEKITSTFDSIAKERGLLLINEDGSLNRRNLGAIVFSDKKLLALQEAIVLPATNQALEDFIENHPNQNLILNATVLYKIPVIHKCTAILYVTAPLLTRFFRAKRRDGMKTMQILQRFFQQSKLFTKYQKSNADIFKVQNTGNKKALEQKVNAILRSIS